MKIMCLSDTHGVYPELDLTGIDLVLFAGDFSFRRRDDIYLQLADFNNKFCPWARRILDKTLFYWISGNHEVFTERLNISISYNDITKYNLDNRSIFLRSNDITIAGFPWTNRFFNWGWNADDNPESMGAKANLIPASADIILSHGPVYGINDLVHDQYKEFIHQGSKELLRRIMEIKPKLFVSGHLHDDKNYSIVEQSGIKFVGCSQMNEKYKYNIRQPVITEI